MYLPGWGNPYCCMWGRGQRGNSAFSLALGWLSVTATTTQKQIGPFSGADSWVGGFVYILGSCGYLQWTLLWGWEFSPAPLPPQVFTEVLRLSLCWNPGLWGLSHSLVVPSSLSACKRAMTWSSSCYLAVHPLHPSCPSPPLLPVWVNVSSLTPWLSDFHTIRFSGSSGYFFFIFVNLLFFFLLCKETKCIYLCLHLGQKANLKICRDYT